MMKFKDYQSAVFDCDGVILDSNRLKTEAFRSALDGEPIMLVDEFIRYHKSHGGISRYVKFDFYYRVMKGVNNHVEETDGALKRYSDICRRGLVECPLIPGIIDILKYFEAHRVECYVISGGDQGEVRAVLAERCLSRYFSAIYGSPRNKMEHLGDLVQTSLKMPAIYFGDADSDSKAAFKYGLDFVFISGKSEWLDGVSVCREVGWQISCDFNHLLGNNKYPKGNYGFTS